eukprot:m51a1_g3081 hypothetical protein (79) ;mRNA; r:55722-56108
MEAGVAPPLRSLTSAPEATRTATTSAACDDVPGATHAMASQSGDDCVPSLSTLQRGRRFVGGPEREVADLDVLRLLLD